MSNPTEDMKSLIRDVLLMEAYCASFRAHILQRLEAGEEIPGASKEPKRAIPSWGDQSGEALALLLNLCEERGLELDIDDLAPRTVRRPGPCKKLLRLKDGFPEDLEALVKTESSGYNLKLKYEDDN